MDDAVYPVILVLALLVVTLWWLRRRGVASFTLRGMGPKRPRSLELIESRALGPGHTLHMVRICDRMVVLAAHAGGCTVIESGKWNERGAE
ncbi:MAG: flagellar biosynthetic protein FliO [Bryobacteraceae bacterium]